MPRITAYKCSECGKLFHQGWGGYRYAENDQGERENLPHPAERAYICDLLHITDEEMNTVEDSMYGRKLKPGLFWSNAKKRKLEVRLEKVKHLLETRVGFNSYCYCLDCLKKSELDLGSVESASESWGRNRSGKKDERLCFYCGSNKVASVLEMVGKLCPCCKKGNIIEIKTDEIY